MNIVFVCQRGDLEIKACLLAWSLRRHLGYSVNLYGAVPDFGDWSELRKETVSIMGELSVKLVRISSPYGDGYPIGNKISALAILPDGELGCFMDSDVVCISRPIDDHFLDDADFAFKPADAATFGNDESWEKVYSILNMDPPQRRVRLTVTGKLSWPYFNAGFVATNKPFSLSQRWLSFVNVLSSSDVDFGERYPWLDQIALPPAAASLGRWRLLDERWNYPVHLRPLYENNAFFCHYHSPDVIAREPRLHRVFRECVDRFSGFSFLVYSSDSWRPLVEEIRTVKWKLSKNRKTDFLITGVPRSGTSLLCNMLHRQPDCVVINEPSQIFPALASRGDGSGIAEYHSCTRGSILLRRPIENKIDGDEVVADTAVFDKRSIYLPEIRSPDFLLGSKNTLVYMSNISRLKPLGWPILAMIRHPIPTLESWNRTFSHLKYADVMNIPMIGPDNKGWDGWQRSSIMEISMEKSEVLRRVLLWRLLARTLMEQEASLSIWRYEDLTAVPRQYLKDFFKGIGRRWRSVELPAMRAPINQANHLSIHRDMLGDLCADELNYFKYYL